jgi:predicted dehydrogenase
MTKVRFGIVGMGIGKNQGRAIAQDPRGEVVALCDLDEGRMREFAAELPGEVRFYTDYRKLCCDPGVDAIFVGTPNQTHVPIALEAIRAGKHVLVTKPLSDSVASAQKLVDAAEQAGVVNMMSLSLRFGGDMQYLGRLARSGEFGEIYYARARSVRRSGIPTWGAHFVSPGGGAFRDMGVHLLDSAWWMAGCPDPVSVMGVAGAKFGPRGLGYMEYRVPDPEFIRQFAVDDYGGGIVRFANGAAIQIESFWACHQPDELQIELFGTEGGVKLSPMTLYRTQNHAPTDTSVKLPKRPDGFAAVAAHFIACVLDGATCEAPLRHGLIVQRMLEGLLKSAATGKETRL